MISKSINMKATYLLVLLVLALFFLCRPTEVAARPLGAADLTYMTEQYPPFNYEEKGRLQGISVDLLEEMLKRMDVDFHRDQVSLTSWMEAYRTAQKVKNTVLFSITRTPEREKLFQWVGPIAPTKVVIITRKDRSIKIKEFNDLKNLKVAALRDDIGEQFLAGRGIRRKEIIVKEKAEDVISMLEEGTVDAWAYEETAGIWLIMRKANNPLNFESVYTLYEGQLYFALNRNTPKVVIQGLQEALNDIKKEKTTDGFSLYEKIFDRYMTPGYKKDQITNEQVMQLVDRTVKDLSRDASGTISRINAGEHPYRDKDNPALYVFVYDAGVTIVAHGDNVKIVGANFKGKTDVNGKPFRDEIVSKAQQKGSGWEDYVYTSPGESGLYYKTTYFMIAAGSDGKTYIVCSGKFKDRDSSPN